LPPTRWIDSSTRCTPEAASTAVPQNPGVAQPAFQAATL
jgi:hypothetical protein